MKSRYLPIIILAMAVLSAGCAERAAQQPTPAMNHEAALRTPPMPSEIPPEPRPEGSLYSDSLKVNLFSDLRARDVGDVITINVVETSKASKEAKTELARGNSVDAGITSFLGFESEIPTNRAGVSPSALIGAKYDSSFNGNGKTTRNESMTAQISARIVQVLPNGNMVIRGSREITVNNEKQYIIIQGLIRQEDISVDNTILSSYIADAKIDYTGRGDLSDKQRPGWLSRLLNNIWPF